MIEDDIDILLPIRFDITPTRHWYHIFRHFFAARLPPLLSPIDYFFAFFFAAFDYRFRFIFAAPIIIFASALLCCHDYIDIINTPLFFDISDYAAAIFFFWCATFRYFIFSDIITPLRARWQSWHNEYQMNIIITRILMPSSEYHYFSFDELSLGRHISLLLLSFFLSSSFLSLHQEYRILLLIRLRLQTDAIFADYFSFSCFLLHLIDISSLFFEYFLSFHAFRLR